MPIEFTCKDCSKLLRVPDGSGGKQCQCPSCSAMLTIPTPKPRPLAPTIPLQNSPAKQTAPPEVTLSIPCPRCKHELLCDPSLLGTKGQCRSCKHIFVITDKPQSTSASEINYVFSCPDCDQLFEGNEGMRGRRGKCHACGSVFTIELRVAESKSPDQSPEQSASERLQSSSPSNRNAASSGQPGKPSGSLFDSLDGELTLDGGDELSLAETPAPAAAPKPKNQSPARAQTESSAPRPPAKLASIQFNCTHCSGRLEVPGSAANQLTHCPHCKKQLSVPEETQPEVAANDPWADLGAFGAPASASPPDPFAAGPYSQPQFPTAPSPAYTPRKSSGSGDGQYIACGILIAVCASIAIALEVLQMVLVVLIIANAPNVNADATIYLTGRLVGVLLLFVLSSLQLLGGIALARRRSLGLARTGAIICCLPCVCLVLNIPFGIWGCILAFGKDAQRKFK